MTRVLFAVDDLSSGGLQRVVTVIANGLARLGHGVVLSSLSRGTPFYETMVPVHTKPGRTGQAADGGNLSVLPGTVKSRLVQKNQSLFQKMKQDLAGSRLMNTPLLRAVRVARWRLLSLPKRRADLCFIRQEATAFRPDALVISGRGIAFGAQLAKEFPSMTVVLWMHNNWKVYFNDYFRGLRGQLSESLATADKVIALSDEDCQGYGRYSRQVVKINNPLTLDTGGRRADLNAQVICVTANYFIEHKGLDYLVDLAKFLPEGWTIDLAGWGTAEQVSALTTLIAQAGVEDRVSLRGSLSGADLADHYARCSICLMTSRWEGFGLVLPEAMAFGLPVVAFDQSGSREVLADGEYGILVPQGDIDALRRQLARLMESRQLRQEYSRKSLERVQDFELAAIIGQWETVLRGEA